ncbi:MAG: glycerophosphodiester phosphodiesterase family protein, partial [Promethearchaeota archaeon]
MLFLKTFQEKKGKKWLLLYFIFLINFLVIEVIFLLLEPFWGEINLIISAYIDLNLNIILLILIIISIPLIYSIFLFISNSKKIKKTNELKPRLIHKFLPLLLIGFFDFIVFLLLYNVKDYSHLIFQRLEFRTIPIFLVLCIFLVIFLYPLLKFSPLLKDYFSNRKLKAKTKSCILLIFISTGYIFTFSYPLLFPPASVIYGNLPPKPDIIGHRGGAELGPENTIEVVEVALDYDIVGWEVDIAISYDGIPFIMHDDTLKRTTNVEDIFPDRKDDYAHSFKWNELRRLDAGSWYIEKDPWGLIARGLITKEQAETYKGAKIPSFKEVLNFSRDNDLILDFDTKSPPEDHPYSEKYIEILFNLTLESGIDLSKVMIPTLSEEWLNLIEERNATDIWTYEDYDNTGDGYSNAEYRAAYERDFTIMVYTIDSIERFSQLWCLGVKWVKTNAPHKFIDLEKPLWYMHFNSYVILWIIVYIAAGCSAILIKILILRKNRVNN